MKLRQYSNEARGEPIGGGLQHARVRHAEERVVVLTEWDPGAGEFLGDERMPVEVVGGVEWHKRRDAHNHRPPHVVADGEVIVREPAALWA